MPTAPFDSPYEMTLSQFITSFLDYPSLRLVTKCLPQLVALIASKCHSFGRKRLGKLCTVDNGFYDDLFDVSLCPLIRSRKRQFAPSVSLVLDHPPFFLPVLVITASKKELCHGTLKPPTIIITNDDDDYQSAANPASYVHRGSASPGSACSSCKTGSTSPCVTATPR